MLYHQIHHEKPIYGGYESRVSYDAMRSTQTYFLNMFHILGSRDDVIKQDLATHGLSLFEHFDVKYVIIHKKLPNYGDVLWNTFNNKFLPEIEQTMLEILGEDIPAYEDEWIVIYKIPKHTSSEPFLLLGSGWNIFEDRHDARTTMKNAEILIINPTNHDISITLNLVLGSITDENTMTVSINNNNPSVHNIPHELTTKQIDNVVLRPGTNVVTLDADEFITIKGAEVSFKVESISITE